MIVKLSDGREVDSYSEAWRLECEIQYVLQKPFRQARLDYLALVEKHRGKPAAEKLRAAVLDAWRAAR